ncbi:hypothetical protein Ancab_004626 [Ancistrocladus abbreviatus]
MQFMVKCELPHTTFILMLLAIKLQGGIGGEAPSNGGGAMGKRSEKVAVALWELGRRRGMGGNNGEGGGVVAGIMGRKRGRGEGDGWQQWRRRKGEEEGWQWWRRERGGGDVGDAIGFK